VAEYLGRRWTRSELLAFLGDPQQVAGATPCVLSDGKAEGVRAVQVRTGGGLELTVLPGRGMDIAGAWFRGRALGFLSGTGITSPVYYEEPGLAWLRSFYAGLLTTCGITYCGAPGVDQGKALGLHGRLANAGAEDLSISQEWEGEEYRIRLSGRMREAQAMGENLTLTRSIETRLGALGFTIHDVVDNRGFEGEPLMLLYHFNFGFPLLGPGARVVGPILRSTPRDEQAAKDRGVEDALSFPGPQPGYEEKVFFHELAADRDGRSLMAVVNPDTGGGVPLGVVMRFNRKQLPAFTQWKMPRKGFYVLGLEPGTTPPLNRGVLRERGELPMIGGQCRYTVQVDVEVLDTLQQMTAVEEEARKLLKR
jgi:hypothetical protein